MAQRALAFAALLLAALPLSASQTHPFSAQDLVGMDRVSDPQPSPDGKWVAFTVRKVDLDANRGRDDLWLVGADGSPARQLTRHEGSDTEPRWAPDGKSLYFLSTRSGSSQVWKLPLEGGEPEQVTDLPLDVSALLISPSGSHLAFSLNVFTDCPTLTCTKERLDQNAKKKGSGQEHDRLFIRHWSSWEDGQRQHLFVRPVAGGEPIDVSKGMDADVPSLPFGGAEEYAFTPDGKEIVFSARIAGKTEAWSTNFDLYVAPIDGSAPPRNLTAANPAWDTQPRFSPDGKTLIYLAMSRAGYEADRFRILAQPWPGGTPREVAPKWDRSPSSLVFSRDGKSLYVTTDDLGRSALFALEVATGEARRLRSEGSHHTPALAGNRIVATWDDFKAPAELYSFSLDGKDARALTSFNTARLAAIRLGDYEPFTFSGAGGDTVYGWLVKPVDFDPAKKYPLAFLIHGGPQGSFANNFHYRWNPQSYAGRGYAAVMIDFHGSTGYGQAFTDAIREDWGGKPFEDLQKGLAAALERYPWIDGSRACALGASYGGYMINWIAGKWFDAAGKPGFRCLVNHAGLFDHRAMYYSTEELWFVEWEHGGPYFANPAAHERHNPVAYVDKWQTPTLVVHGALDFRVPEAQGFGTFTALQRRGIPSKLLYFPDENHWVLKPQNSLQWHEAVLGWLDQWTKE